MSSPSASDRDHGALRDEDASATSPTHSTSSGVGYNPQQQSSSSSSALSGNNSTSWPVDGNSSSSNNLNRQWTGAASANVSKLPQGCSSAAEYLSQLVKDKKQLSNFQYLFFHVERLLDKEINQIRDKLFDGDGSNGNSSGNGGEKLALPDPIGAVVQRTEKIYVPIKEYPDYNFVGRILGPRGMTAKQIEKDTGCRIMIRGKGSMRDKRKEELNRGKPNWEHLNDELHVLVQCEDTENRIKVRVERAIVEIKKLLVPMNEGEDELKKRQLMELAIMNGTYRDASHAAQAAAAAAEKDSPFSSTSSSSSTAALSTTAALLAALSAAAASNGVQQQQPTNQLNATQQLAQLLAGGGGGGGSQQQRMSSNSSNVDFLTAALLGSQQQQQHNCSSPFDLSGLGGSSSSNGGANGQMLALLQAAMQQQQRHSSSNAAVNNTNQLLSSLDAATLGSLLLQPPPQPNGGDHFNNSNSNNQRHYRSAAGAGAGAGGPLRGGDTRNTNNKRYMGNGRNDPY